MRILIIAPHPDDEVLGCGGTIAKHSENGDEVYLCIVTKGYPPDWSKEFIKNERAEIGKASKILGIKKTFFLDFPAAKLDTVPEKELNEGLSMCLNKVKPQMVYIPHRGDINKDHYLIFKAATVVTRPKPESSIKKVLSYEVLSETEWGVPQLKKDIFVPNVYIDISETLKDKLKAMSCYKNELKQYPHPRSLEAITVLAKKRGIEVGLEAAEAFIVIREIQGV